MTIIALKAENIIWRRIEDDIVVITDDGLATHVLNKTAAFIWEQCNGERSVDQIAAQLCEMFDVSFEEASVDTQVIILKLIDIGIMSQVEESEKN
jgi:hypothetical protein